MSFFNQQSDCLEVYLYIQPRSSENKIVGLIDNRLKIKLKAPPVDGAANKMCIKFLSKTFHISKSKIEIVSGHNNRKKKLRIDGDSQKIISFFKKYLNNDNK